MLRGSRGFRNEIGRDFDDAAAAASQFATAIAEIRDDLQRAGKYLKRLDATTSSAMPRGFLSAWPDYPDRWSAYGAEPDHPRVEPITWQQHAHLDRVDGWITELVDTRLGFRRRRAAWLFVLGVKPGRAARKLECHRNTYRALVDDAIADILAGLIAARPR